MDNTKTRWHFLPWEVLHFVVEAFQEGAFKYGENGWQTEVVKNTGPTTYWDAAMRHLQEYRGENDYKGRMYHLARAAANCLILLWRELHVSKSAAQPNAGPNPGSDRGTKPASF